jgi:hypothetical protein
LGRSCSRFDDNLIFNGDVNILGSSRPAPQRLIKNWEKLQLLVDPDETMSHDQLPPWRPDQETLRVDNVDVRNDGFAKEWAVMGLVEQT